MNEQDLSLAIQKNLELIKNETSKLNPHQNEQDNEEKEDRELINDLPKARSSGEFFEFSANRMFFNDIYFRNSKLIRM